MVVTEQLKEAGVDGEIIEYVQKLVNEVAFQTIEPFIMQIALPEDVEFMLLYMRMGLGMISQTDFTREAMALGYDVHGHGDEEGHGRVEVPDLSGFMPEIADAFEGYLRDQLPQIPGFEDFMDEARVEGIVMEVRDHLLDSPPDMGAVLDMIEQLGLTEETSKMFMRDMKNYFTSLIKRIL
jgi:hypothetical protein